MRIGLPLDGWDLAVVDGDRTPVGAGRDGGADHRRRRPGPLPRPGRRTPRSTRRCRRSGWERAYRSGDLVRVRRGRDCCSRAGPTTRSRSADGGSSSARSTAPCSGSPGVIGAAAAVRRTARGQPAPGRLRHRRRRGSTSAAAMTRLRAQHARRAGARGWRRVDSIPTRTSGKVDRDALPVAAARGRRRRRRPPSCTAPPPGSPSCGSRSSGAPCAAGDDDFFDLGGGSLTAAQLVSRLREPVPRGDRRRHLRAPDRRRPGRHARRDGRAERHATDRAVRPTPLKTQIGQIVAIIPLRDPGRPALADLAAGRPTTWPPRCSRSPGSRPCPGGGRSPAGCSSSRRRAGWRWPRSAPGCCCAGSRPGDHPRGGKVHLRLWLAERLADELGATNLAGAPLMTWYARLLGAKVGQARRPALVPPVTGLLSSARLLDRARGRPTGHWLDGDVLHIGEVGVGKRARIGARSMLCPGAASATTPRWRRGRRSSARSRTASSGPAPRPSAVSGAARGPWSASVRRAARVGGWRTRQWPSLLSPAAGLAG